MYEKKLKMSVQIKDIVKYYGDQKALDQVNFTIETGEIVGFLGPNGAGKSTMMKIMTGFLLPESGQVFINSKNIEEHPVEFKKDIGYLPENTPLYTEMYVKEYLGFVSGIFNIKNKNRIDEIIQMTGLEKEQHKKINALSKGYRQRIGLAQALIHDPQVLILDEPTAGLDPNQIIEIRNLISEIGKEKTVMISTHIMQEVEAICDRIIIINNGKIVADDITSRIQQHTVDEVVTFQVEFDKPVDPGFMKSLKDIHDMKRISDREYLLQCPADKEIRNEIFHLAVKHHLVLLTIHKKEKSLETVFRELTERNN